MQQYVEVEEDLNYIQKAEQMFAAVEKDPMLFPYGRKVQFMFGINAITQGRGGKISDLHDFVTRVENLLHESLTYENVTVFLPFAYFAGLAASQIDPDRHQRMTLRLREAVMVKLKNKSVSKNGDAKSLVKLWLSWFLDGRQAYSQEYLQEATEVSAEILNELRQPLDEYYAQMQTDDAGRRVIDLQMDEKYACDAEIIESRQRMILPNVDSWYYNRTKRSPRFLMPDAYDDVIAQMDGYGIRSKKLLWWRDGYQGTVAAALVLCELCHQIAAKLVGPFGELVGVLFTQNRTNLGIPLHEDETCGVRRPPVKTISRGNAKVIADYRDDPDPQPYSVLDWCRCAVVVKNEEEMLALFDVICDQFTGKVVRVKNGFSPAEESNFGYRAILICVIFEHEGLRMICEIQLILAVFLKVRKKMHIYYKINRSANPRHLSDDFAKILDLR